MLCFVLCQSDIGYTNSEELETSNSIYYENNIISVNLTQFLSILLDFDQFFIGCLYLLSLLFHLFYILLIINFNFVFGASNAWEGCSQLDRMRKNDKMEPVHSFR